MDCVHIAIAVLNIAVAVYIAYEGFKWLFDGSLKTAIFYFSMCALNIACFALNIALVVIV